MTRFGVITKDGYRKGYILAKDFQEAQTLLKNKTPIIQVTTEWQEYDIGFSDQWVVSALKFSALENYPNDYEVKQQLQFYWDNFVGARLQSEKEDYSNIPVLALDFTTKIGELEHSRRMPTVTIISMYPKVNRQWYATGWKIYYQNVAYWFCRNMITDQSGLVKEQKGLIWQRTALETFFEGMTKNLDALESKIYKGVVKPIQETIKDTKEGISNTFTILVTLSLLGIMVNFLRKD